MRYTMMVVLGTLAMNAQAHTYQELNHYVQNRYGDGSDIQKRTKLIFDEFEKEARQKLPEITQAIHEQQPDRIIRFSNTNCAVSEDGGDYMPYCTYVFTSYTPGFNSDGSAYGVVYKHTFCKVPIALDFKIAVNYTYDYLYLPATQAGEEPNLLEYPPAGDPTKKAIQYLQDCLEDELIDKP